MKHVARRRRPTFVGGAALLALLLAVGPIACAHEARRDPERICVTADQWSAGVVERSSGVSIIVIADVNGPEAAAIVGRINNTPPETHMVADRIIVLSARNVSDNAPARPTCWSPSSIMTAW